MDLHSLRSEFDRGAAWFRYGRTYSVRAPLGLLDREALEALFDYQWAGLDPDTQVRCWPVRAVQMKGVDFDYATCPMLYWVAWWMTKYGLSVHDIEWQRPRRHIAK